FKCDWSSDVCSSDLDAAGNLNTVASQLTRTYDGTRPSVALSSSSSSQTNAAFTVTATFSEAVTGFSLVDVSVGNGAKSSLSGSRSEERRVGKVGRAR